MAEYTGPVCYVGNDHEAADGRMLEGGWHYTVVQDTHSRELAIAAAKAQLKRASKSLLPGRKAAAEQELADIEERAFEMPGEKLFLDAKTSKYRVAKDGDKSWHERHHKRLALVAPEGSIGQPETDEEYDAAHRHLNELEERMLTGGLDPHEHDHLLQTPGDVHTLRTWLERSRT